PPEPSYQRSKRLRLIYLSLAIFLVLAGCESKPKVSAQQMKRSLLSVVFEFNKDVGGMRFDDAKTYVAPAADAKFDDLVAQVNARKFNLLMTDEPPQIDYLQGDAKVPVRLFLGE